MKVNLIIPVSGWDEQEAVDPENSSDIQDRKSQSFCFAYISDPQSEQELKFGFPNLM